MNENLEIPLDCLLKEKSLTALTPDSTKILIALRLATNC